MKYLAILFLLVAAVGCSVKPQPINFGKDACVFCKMNIVDKQHAAELVTNKGKVFKYDAIECLLQDTERNKEDEVSLYLVVDYLNPEGFIDATKATYLVSEAIPSPMGAYLSAFKEQSKAKDFVKTEDDKLYSWSEIQQGIQ